MIWCLGLASRLGLVYLLKGRSELVGRGLEDSNGDFLSSEIQERRFWGSWAPEDSSNDCGTEVTQAARIVMAIPQLERQ